ncbi:hypothetical protein FTO68_10705 [Methanocalculus taiwanensis]|uniref:Yip1 domain-containing protein n=1 Tax=Methanocalculus taiwanensis TaxID=106207 RepID=A0ABD4TMC7_9EURY|nr:hypothetical protein [Methanocalculus taiwanensis]MCQ1539447.1 hypothetical protein [Methanocalculus taiwanensis]
MDGNNVPKGSSSDHIFSGVSIKNEPFAVSVDRGLLRLTPESGTGGVREFSRGALFDAVPETDSEGLPSLALAINTPGGIRRMVLSFPEWAGGTAGRNRLERLVHRIIEGADSPSGNLPVSEGVTFPGVRIKGASFTIGIGGSGITLTPENAVSRIADFSPESIKNVDIAPENGDDPALLLSIAVNGATRNMILAFPREAGGIAARNRAIRSIHGIGGAEKQNSRNLPSLQKPATPICSVSGMMIKETPFRSDIFPDRIALIQETGNSVAREFTRSEIFDIVPEFTPDGIQSAVLAIRTPSGIRRMILLFPEEIGGAAERDRFAGLVRGILDGTIGTATKKQQAPLSPPPKTEYPICQRSELCMDDQRIGLLLTSKRLIIYQGDGQHASVREEFRIQQVLDASPTIDIRGKPAVTISLITKEKEIVPHTIVFDDEGERNSWISLLTADETPPPMIEEDYDEGAFLRSTTQEEAIGAHREEEEDGEEIPQPASEDQKPPPANRCPVCGTILSPESPWCDSCGIRLSSDCDWRGLSEYVLHTGSCDTLTPPPKREYGRLLTFLFVPSGAGRFKDDPIRLPLLFFLTSILTCILGTIAIIGILSDYAGLDPTLFPVMSEFIASPVMIGVFTASALLVAAILVLITATLAFLFTGRVEGSLGRVLRITLYSVLPFGIAGLIPVIGILIACLWSILILSGALRSTFDFSVSASLFPPVVSYGAVIFAVIFLSGGMV